MLLHRNSAQETRTYKTTTRSFATSGRCLLSAQGVPQLLLADVLDGDWNLALPRIKGDCCGPYLQARGSVL